MTGKKRKFFTWKSKNVLFWHGNVLYLLYTKNQLKDLSIG
jgi:hypothetical protein